jgi:hypothetical protein
VTGPAGRAPDGDDGTDLVPGELRGFRQFRLAADGLYPLVHHASGPWDGELETARCSAGQAHRAPAAGCRCGLYAWYLPGSATVALGPASAVVSARGRCILGDRGFRAAQARIEAVSLPALVRLSPRAAARARRMLAERYPGTRVYGSTRQMLREHPPQSVEALGIVPPADRSRGYRAAAVGVGLGVVAMSYSLAAVPPDVLSTVVARWWPLLVVLAIVWQAVMVWLFTKLLALQGTAPTRFGAAPPTEPTA